MITYTKVVSEEQVNQFYILASSFTYHHPDRVLYCQTRLKLKEISGVVYLGLYEDVEKLGEVFCYLSPHICFFAPIEHILQMKVEGQIIPNDRPAVRNDMYFYNKKHREIVINYGNDVFLNMSLPPFIDCGSVIGYRDLTAKTPMINTREFNPSIKQRNSYKTLIFPWERYFQVVKMAGSLLEKEYVDSVVENCKRHPYMLYYYANGYLQGTDGV